MVHKEPSTHLKDEVFLQVDERAQCTYRPSRENEGPSLRIGVANGTHAAVTARVPKNWMKLPS